MSDDDKLVDRLLVAAHDETFFGGHSGGVMFRALRAAAIAFPGPSASLLLTRKLSSVCHCVSESSIGPQIASMLRAFATTAPSSCAKKNGQ